MKPVTWLRFENVLASIRSVMLLICLSNLTNEIPYIVIVWNLVLWTIETVEKLYTSINYVKGLRDIYFPILTRDHVPLSTRKIYQFKNH